MATVLYPYATLDGRLDLKVTVESRGVAFDHDERTIDFRLAEAEGRDLVSLSLSVRAPQGELVALGYDDLQVVAVAECSRTDTRQGFKLKRSKSEPALWSGSLDLFRGNFRGEAIIRTTLTGTAKNVPHRFLASSEPWTVVLDDATSRLIGGTVRVKWMDFGDREDLKPYWDEPFYLDLEENQPTVYLNKRIEGLHEVLPTHGQPTGPLRSLYETLRTGIARSVWKALLQAALAGIDAAPDEADGGEPTWPQIQWQQDVLRAVLSKVYPEASEGEILRRAVAARTADNEARQLSSRALLVIEKDIVRDGTAIRRALKAINDYIREERQN